jgi:CRP/FNR family transcriptional regulator, nitrogen oxide reductase regulator
MRVENVNNDLRETPEWRSGSTFRLPVNRLPKPNRQLTSQLASVISSRLRAELLDGLAKSDRDETLAAALLRRFSRNRVVVNQGDAADRLFLLLKGSARFFFITPEGRKVYLLWLSPGDIFGGATLLSQPARFLVSTEVTKGSQTLVWSRSTIQHLAAKYPKLLENSLSIASDYLVWYLASHLSLICHTARQRLAHVLISLAEGIGHVTSTGIRLDVTNEQLANTANITLFTASRLLSDWQRSGAVTKRRGMVWLHHPERLFHDRDGRGRLDG